MDKHAKIRIVGPKEIPRTNFTKELKTNGFVDTTSYSEEKWSLELSPFYLGPIELYDKFVSKNLENAWQYTKVYKKHLIDGEISDEYWKWCKEGWESKKAIRFPMGRGAKPEFSLWKGNKLNYIDARKQIYAPLYVKYVENTDAYKKLKKMYETLDEIILWDFDGYDYNKFNKTLEQVINDPNKKMGHSFILAMMLTNNRVWEKK